MFFIFLIQEARKRWIVKNTINRVISDQFKCVKSRSLDLFHYENSNQVITQENYTLNERSSPICKRLFSQAEDFEPHLKKDSPYGN